MLQWTCLYNPDHCFPKWSPPGIDFNLLRVHISEKKIEMYDIIWGSALDDYKLFLDRLGLTGRRAPLAANVGENFNTREIKIRSAVFKINPKYNKTEYL